MRVGVAVFATSGGCSPMERSYRLLSDVSDRSHRGPCDGDRECSRGLLHGAVERLLWMLAESLSPDREIRGNHSGGQNTNVLDDAFMDVDTDGSQTLKSPLIEGGGIQSDHLPADGAQRLLEVR